MITTVSRCLTQEPASCATLTSLPRPFYQSKHGELFLSHLPVPHDSLAVDQEPPTPGRGPSSTSTGVPGQFDSAPEGGRRSGRFGPESKGDLPGAGPAGAGAGGVGAAAESGMNFAERMMAKMGHKEGQGQQSSQRGRERGRKSVSVSVRLLLSRQFVPPPLLSLLLSGRRLERHTA